MMDVIRRVVIAGEVSMASAVEDEVPTCTDSAEISIEPGPDAAVVAGDGCLVAEIAVKM